MGISFYVFSEYSGAALTSLGSADEEILRFAEGQEIPEVLLHAIKRWQLSNRQRDGVKKRGSVPVKW